MRYSRRSPRQVAVNIFRASEGLQLWRAHNIMEKGIKNKKSAVVLFHRSQSPFLLHYTLKCESLERVSRYNDLEVVFCPLLSPAEHIASVSRRASSLLGFVCRSSRDLLLPLHHFSLYITLLSVQP